LPLHEDYVSNGDGRASLNPINNRYDDSYGINCNRIGKFRVRQLQ
jgi:hypothetical protein